MSIAHRDHDGHIIINDAQDIKVVGLTAELARLNIFNNTDPLCRVYSSVTNSLLLFLPMEIVTVPQAASSVKETQIIRGFVDARGSTEQQTAERTKCVLA
jgi:hypothetical protein